MKRFKRVLSGTSAAVLSLSSLLTMGFTGVAHAAAQTCTWTGTASDKKFSTATNWSNCGSAAPLAGDIIVFDAANMVADADATYRMSVTNDLAVSLGGVRTTASSPAMVGALVISQLRLIPGGFVEQVYGGPSGNGAGISIGDNTTLGTLTGDGDVTINARLEAKYNVTGSLNVQNDPSTLGGISLSATDVIHGLTLQKGTQVYVTADVAGTSSVDYPISVVDGGSSASTSILGFTAFCSQTDSMGGCNAWDPVTWNVTGQLTLASDLDIYTGPATTVNIQKALAGVGTAHPAVGSAGTVNIGSVAIDFPVKTTTYSGVKTDSIGVAKNETAILEADAVYDVATVYDGGLLKGNGSIKYNLTVLKGGTISPGNSPGCITVGSLSIAGQYQFELGGVDPCTGYDQIKVTDTTLTTPTTTFDADATIATSRFNDYTPEQGQSFTIIDVAGTQAVSGTFKDLPEDATFTQNGILFKITYKGGDGNDVVLTVQNQPTTPDTGFALISANPLLTLGATAGAAIILVGMARKNRPAHARAHAARRRK